MIRNYPVHPVVTITIAAAVTVRDLRGRAVVLVLPDPEAVPVPLVQWDLRAPRVNPDFKTRLSTVVKKELIASHIIINLLFLLKSVIYCTAGKQSNNRPFQKSEVQKILFI